MALSDFQISRPVSAVTPVLSSLAGALRQYIEGLFPSDFFKDYFIDTELPTLRRTRAFRPLTRSQLAHRKLPLLSVRTEATADQSDYATGVAWYTGGRFLRDPSQLSPLVIDDANLRYIGYQTERIVVRFQLSIIVETEMKAREVMMYLRRVAPAGMKTFLNGVFVATEIPGDLLRSMWVDAGFGDGSSADEVNAFHHYLRSVSAGNIEQVINSATGRLAYAFHYKSNPVMNIPSLPSASSNRDGNVIRTASVEMQVELDLEVPMSYAYKQEARLEPTESTDGSMAPDIGAGALAYFSFAKAVRPASTIDNNLGLAYFVAIVTGDVDQQNPLAPDITDLSTSIPNDVKKYIDFMRGSVGNETNHRAVLWVDGQYVRNDWSFNWSTWTLTIDASIVRYKYKYHFGLYADLAMYRETADDIPNSRPKPPSPYFTPK